MAHRRAIVCVSLSLLASPLLVAAYGIFPPTMNAECDACKADATTCPVTQGVSYYYCGEGAMNSTGIGPQRGAMCCISTANDCSPQSVNINRSGYWYNTSGWACDSPAPTDNSGNIYVYTIGIPFLAVIAVINVILMAYYCHRRRQRLGSANDYVLQAH